MKGNVRPPLKAKQQPNELFVDAEYRNTNDWKNPHDQFNSFFRFSDGRGINNTSGFRPKSRANGSTSIKDCGFCVLVTNFGETEWPDSLDADTGQFTYYGDNRKPGKRLAETFVGGNRLLENVFAKLHDGHRDEICPFLCFESFQGADGMYMRFLGLAVPGAEGVSSLDDLVAIWRRRDNQRFQNYRATFTILDESTVKHSWLEAILAGNAAATAEGCPHSFSLWVRNGKYNALTAPQELVPRPKFEQLPKTAREWRVLDFVLTLDDRQFEHASGSLLQMMDRRYRDIKVTRAVQDGGRDVLATYRVGHDNHSIALDVCLEAKRWDPATSIGVKPMMRLISRLKHRDFGIFVTTSYFDRIVQRELIADGHPVVLIAGGDIARMLISEEREGDALERWLESVRSQAEI